MLRTLMTKTAMRNILVTIILVSLVIDSYVSITFISFAFEKKQRIIVKYGSKNYPNRYRLPIVLPSSSSDFNLDVTKLTIAASQKLSWEINDEKSQKPILNLSLRDATVVDNNKKASKRDDTSDWDEGQRWNITVEKLSSLIFENSDGTHSTGKRSAAGSAAIQETSMLKKCPQLYRLDPSTIEETANFIKDEFGIHYLERSVFFDNPVILSYKKDDVAYGLKYMSTMMMMDAKPMCGTSSALLLQGINGGIQERLISNALGAASDATSKAAKSIASDNMESLRQLRTTTRLKK